MFGTKASLAKDVYSKSEKNRVLTIKASDALENVLTDYGADCLVEVKRPMTNAPVLKAGGAPVTGDLFQRRRSIAFPDWQRAYAGSTRLKLQAIMSDYKSRDKYLSYGVATPKEAIVVSAAEVEELNFWGNHENGLLYVENIASRIREHIQNESAKIRKAFHYVREQYDFDVEWLYRSTEVTFRPQDDGSVFLNIHFNVLYTAPYDEEKYPLFWNYLGTKVFKRFYVKNKKHTNPNELAKYVSKTNQLEKCPEGVQVAWSMALSGTTLFPHLVEKGWGRALRVYDFSRNEVSQYINERRGEGYKLGVEKIDNDFEMVFYKQGQLQIKHEKNTEIESKSVPIAFTNARPIVTGKEVDGRLETVMGNSLLFCGGLDTKEVIKRLNKPYRNKLGILEANIFCKKLARVLSSYMLNGTTLSEFNDWVVEVMQSPALMAEIRGRLILGQKTSKRQMSSANEDRSERGLIKPRPKAKILERREALVL